MFQFQQHYQNPPPVITLYKWAIQGKSQKQSHKQLGVQWAQEPKEVKNFFSSIYQSLKHSKTSVDLKKIQESWQFSQLSFTEEEDTSDQSLCFSEISSIHHIEEDFYSQVPSLMESCTSAFLQYNTKNEIESFCKMLDRLTLNSKNVDESFINLSKLIL